VHPAQPVEMFLRHLIPWPPVDIHRKFYTDRPRGTLPSRELNTRGVAKYSDFDLSDDAMSRKRCKIGGKLVLITNRKSHMSFRLVPKSVTLNYLEQHNGRYFALFHRTRVRCRRETIISVSKSTFNSL